MDLIKRLFGGNGQADAPSVAHPAVALPQAPAASVPPTHDFDAQLHTRRELVRVRTRNTMRLSGIAENWIEPQVMLEPGGGRVFLHLRLVVRHWDERLVLYAVAFQNKLMTEIERIDPQARQWLLSIVWCYPPDIECPYQELPQPSEWMDLNLDEPHAPAVDELQSDLAQLFAVRDADMAKPGARGGSPGA